MITAADTGHLIVYVTDDPVDDAVIASAIEMISGNPIIIDGLRAGNCYELATTIACQGPGRNIVISNLLEAFYDASIPTREAAQILGRVKSTLESLIVKGVHIVVLCRRRSEDLGTRSHFVASLCASADRVYFRRST
jgi:hypothetical protein